MTSLNPSLTPDCASAVQAALPGLVQVCGGNTPSVQALAANLTGYLDGVCSTNCGAAVRSFTTTAASNCQNQVILNDNFTTAAVLSLELGLFQSLDGNYCLVSQVSSLMAAGITVSPNATSDQLATQLIGLFQSNPQAICTVCLQKEVDALTQALTAFTQSGQTLPAGFDVYANVLP
ncbi:hypothetical protein HDU91_007229, partial [Kappamyces sp. JEL0680]